MKAILDGGLRDGLCIDLGDQEDNVQIPFVEASRVLTMDEFDDPDNWEPDPLDGHMRLKRPGIGVETYTRTTESRDGRVIFR